MAHNEKEDVAVLVRPRTSSNDSVVPSSRSPRTPRFAEATSVNSPIEPSQAAHSAFNQSPVPTTFYQPQPQPSDIGFGYISDNNPAHRSTYGQGVEMPPTPRSPLRSALRPAGAPPRKLENPISPTFIEEQALEKQEDSTDKEQARDLKVKIRVRLAKMVLRGTNFSCSLIVLSMIATTFTIFNTTKSLPPRNNLPAWAQGISTWPQITLLCVACISLFMSVLVFHGYWRGGHRRAEKVAVYYSIFAVAFFTFSIVMWATAAAVLHQSKANGNGHDMWGWSCNDNTRRTLFQEEVHYTLICRLQNWSLVCAIIEIVIETITIAIYGIVFYRYYSLRRLRKSMATRDRARSDLYLAQLRSQSAPNTPGFGPMSAREGGYNPMFSPRWGPNQKEVAVDEYSAAELGDSKSVRYLEAPAQAVPKKPFTLQAPPTRTTPKMPQREFEPQGLAPSPAPLMAQVLTPTAAQARLPPMSPMSAAVQSEPVHQPAAPGEQQYGAVPIPGAYASPLTSPKHAPAQAGYFAPMR